MDKEVFTFGNIDIEKQNRALKVLFFKKMQILRKY